MGIYVLVSEESPILTDAVCKIGYSAGDAGRRRYDVGTSCPFDLEPYAVFDGDKALEEEIHRLLDKDRIRREWFWWTDDVEELIDEVQILGDTLGYDKALAQLKKR